MAMPQRDDPPSRYALRRTGTIEAIKRLEPPSRERYGAPGALLEYAVICMVMKKRPSAFVKSCAS